MENDNLPEAWLRGPVEGIDPLLQPVAHALIQSKEEIEKYTRGFPDELIWQQPAGRASVAFHLQHIAGVIDRMLTYAHAENLTTEQFEYLDAEGKMNETIKLKFLKEAAIEKIEEAISHLSEISPSNLLEKRTVGRKKLPSTLIGLLFHAGEHTQRHIGQMLVTISILKERSKKEV